MDGSLRVLSGMRVFWVAMRVDETGTQEGAKLTVKVLLSAIDFGIGLFDLRDRG